MSILTPRFDFVVHVWPMVSNFGVLLAAILAGWKVLAKVDKLIAAVHRVLDEHDTMYTAFPEMHALFVSMKDKKANGDSRVLRGQ